MIYLREKDGQYVGPFRSRNDAERFIDLMRLCDENWAGAEIVDEERTMVPAVWHTDRIS